MLLLWITKPSVLVVTFHSGFLCSECMSLPKVQACRTISPATLKTNGNMPITVLTQIYTINPHENWAPYSPFSREALKFLAEMGRLHNVNELRLQLMARPHLTVQGSDH